MKRKTHYDSGRKRTVFCGRSKATTQSTTNNAEVDCALCLRKVVDQHTAALQDILTMIRGGGGPGYRFKQIAAIAGEAINLRYTT